MESCFFGVGDAVRPSVAVFFDGWVGDFSGVYGAKSPLRGSGGFLRRPGFGFSPLQAAAAVRVARCLRISPAPRTLSARRRL